MAGGALKGIGGVLMALGGVLVLTGLAAAVTGGTWISDANHGLFWNNDQAQAGADVVAVGLLAAGVGLVLLVLGVVLFAMGASRARRELLEAAAARPIGAEGPRLEPAPLAPSRPGNPWVVLGAVAALLLVAALVVGVAGIGVRGGSTSSAAMGTQSQSFTGHLQGNGAVSPPENQHLFAPASHNGRLRAQVEATGGLGQTGAHVLLVVESADGQGGWREIARVDGSGGEVNPTASSFPGQVRFRVSLAGAGVADLDYAVHVAFTPV